MSGAAAKLLDLLFPPKCVFCGKILPAGAKHLCPVCQRQLPWLEGAAAEQKGEFFSLCVSPLRYQDKVRDSIRRYKFQGRRGYHKAYGMLVAQCVKDHLAGKYDLITWVPLSDKRKKERGYDQAFLLASAAALELGDVAVDLETGRVKALVVPGRLRLFGLLGREKDHVFPWSSVRRFGEDIILVEETGPDALEEPDKG